MCTDQAVQQLFNSVRYFLAVNPLLLIEVPHTHEGKQVFLADRHDDHR